MKLKIANLLQVGLMLSLISACGWHLRGATDLPDNLSSLYVTAEDAHGALITEIKRMLEASNVTLAESSGDAPYSLVILEERTERRTAGVGSDALTSAYQVTLSVDYEIRSSQNQLLSPMTTASTSRTYDYNAANASSSEQEEALLLREMRRDISLQMLRRVQLVTTADAAPAAENAPAETGGTDGQTAP